MLRSGSKASSEALREGMSCSYRLPRSIVSIMLGCAVVGCGCCIDNGGCGGEEAGAQSGLL